MKKSSEWNRNAKNIYEYEEAIHQEFEAVFEEKNCQACGMECGSRFNGQ